MRAGRVVVAFLAGISLGVGVALAALGHRRRALGWLAALVVALLGGLAWFPLFVVALACWFGSAVDAAMCAAKRSDLRGLFTDSAGIQFLVNLAVLLGLREMVLEAFKIPSSGMLPTLDVGDHVFVDKLTAHLRTPARGDVLVFKYPCYPGRDYVKRVVAIAGDTVEVRCNVVYVNASAVPTELVDAHASYLDHTDGTAEWYPHAASRYREHLGGHTYEVFHDPERAGRHAPDAFDFPKLDGSSASCANADDTLIGEPDQGKIISTPASDPCAPQVHYVVPAGHFFVLGDNRNNSSDSRIWGSIANWAVKGRVLGIWMTDNPHTWMLGRVGPVD